MVSHKKKRAPGGGRKPSGDQGERVSEYPALIMRLPIRTQAPMRALAKIRNVPLWRLFDEAAWLMLNQLKRPEAQRVITIGRQEVTKLKAKSKQTTR